MDWLDWIELVTDSPWVWLAVVLIGLIVYFFRHPNQRSTEGEINSLLDWLRPWRNRDDDP
jgi:hypothetical protein